MGDNDLEKEQLDFLATLSHEIRTPLTSIRGFADTMLISYDKLSDEQKIKFLKVIKEQANRLISLVENLLSASKSETISKNLIYKSVIPKNIIDKAIFCLKNKFPDKIFNINDKSSSAKILVDEDKFLQIIINLLENSAKYGDNDKPTEINISASNDDMSIIIKNDGLVLEEKDFENIFKKFTRVDNPLTRNTEGSGIGLFIVKSLTEAMEGTISPIKYDKGACFELKFKIDNGDNLALNKLKRG